MILTKNTTELDIRNAHKNGIKFIKYMPEHGTTNSQNGIPLYDLKNYYHLFEVMRDLGMILMGHWELVEHYPDGILIDERKRELYSIPFLKDAHVNFPSLKISVEHISLRVMIEFVKSQKNLGGSLTVHHATLSSNDVFKKGRIFNPHHYCKPIVKSTKDRKAIVEVMLSGNPQFFFGSDSAPHLKEKKVLPKPAAGIFSAPVALPTLVEVFDKYGQIGKVEDFVSRFGAEYYNLPLNKEDIYLEKEEWTVPNETHGIFRSVQMKKLLGKSYKIK